MNKLFLSLVAMMLLLAVSAPARAGGHGGASGFRGGAVSGFQGGYNGNFRHNFFPGFQGGYYNNNLRFNGIGYGLPLIVQQPALVTYMVPQSAYATQQTVTTTTTTTTGGASADYDPGTFNPNLATGAATSYGATGYAAGGYAAGAYGALPLLDPQALAYLQGLTVVERQAYLFRQYGAHIGSRLFHHHYGANGISRGRGDVIPRVGGLPARRASQPLVAPVRPLIGVREAARIAAGRATGGHRR